MKRVIKSLQKIAVLVIIIHTICSIDSNAQIMTDYIWVPCYGSDDVYKINVNTHQVDTIISVGDGPGGIAVGQNNVSVTHISSTWLYQISKVNNSVDSVDLSSVMAFSIAVAYDHNDNVFVIGRENSGIPNMDMAKIAKINPDGVIIDSSSLTLIQASQAEDGPFGNIGITIDRGGRAFIPWNRSWNGGNGIIILNTLDLSFVIHNISPSTYGYRGPGASYDNSNTSWSSGERMGENYLISLSQQDLLDYKYIGNWDLGPNHYRGLSVDTLDNVWTGNPFGFLIEFDRTVDSVYVYDVGADIGGISIDLNGYIWVVMPSINSVIKYDYEGNQVGDTVYVGNRPLGYGDMSGSEFSVVENNPIPTLSEWGMLIMGLLLLALGTVAVIRKRKAVLSK